jgi:hypothetical protein
MKFRAKLDDPESRAFWENIKRGARRYDALPDWQKGLLGGVAPGREKETSEAEAERSSLPVEEE